MVCMVSGVHFRDETLAHWVKQWVCHLRTQSTVKHPNKGRFGGGPFVPCRVERFSSSGFLLNLLESSRYKHLKVFHFDDYEMARAKLLA